MRWFVSLALAFAISGSACAQEESIQQEQQITSVEELLEVVRGDEATIAEAREIVSPWRGGINCTGVAQQGGAVLCQTNPNARVKVARSEKDFYFENANEEGLIIIGFDRNEKSNFVEVEGERVSFDLKPRKYDTSRIDGLPPSQVSTFTDCLLYTSPSPRDKRQSRMPSSA